MRRSARSTLVERALRARFLIDSETGQIRADSIQFLRATRLEWVVRAATRRQPHGLREGDTA